MFHAFMGCDTVSSFVGHGKRALWPGMNYRHVYTYEDLTDNPVGYEEVYNVAIYDRCTVHVFRYQQGAFY